MFKSLGHSLRAVKNAFPTFLMLTVLTLHAPLCGAQFLDQREYQREQMHQQAREAMLQGNYAVAYCIWPKPLVVM